MRRLLVSAWISAILVVTVPVPCGAEDHPEGKPAPAGQSKDAHGKDAHAPKSENPLSPAADLGIWTLVVFALLYLFLRYFPLPGANGKSAWTAMLGGLQRREETIRGALDDAKKAREEAQQLRVHLQKQLDKAGEMVRDILDEARRDAQHTTEEMVSKARGEIQTERDRLRREIEMARDQALQELWNQTATLATLVSAKAIRRQLSPDDHRRLVDEALADLRQAGSDRRQA